MGKAAASDAELVAAARAANCHDFICQSPQGYDTHVGEIGGTHQKLLAQSGRYARMWAAQQAARSWQLTGDRVSSQ